MPTGARRIAFAHHKGGTGKTTSCLNLAGCLQARGRRVLVVDMDPQAHATSGLGIDPATAGENLYSVLAEGRPLSQVVLETESGVHLAPSSLDLAGAEVLLQSRPDRLQALARALGDVASRYEFILLDSPPGSGLLMLNCLAVADLLAVPVDSGVFARESLKSLHLLLGDLREATGAGPRLWRILVVANRRGLFESLGGGASTNGLQREAGTIFGGAVEVTRIPYSSAVVEAQRRGLPLHRVSPGSAANRAYERLADMLTSEDRHG